MDLAVPNPKALRMITPRLRPATKAKCRFRTASCPRSQDRRPPPVSQMCAKDRSVYLVVKCTNLKGRTRFLFTSMRSDTLRKQ